MSRGRFRWAFLTSVWGALVAGPAFGQCPMPDGFDGNNDCIGVFPTVTLPEFPPMEVESTLICWKDCSVETQVPVIARWGRLRPATKGRIPALCSVYLSRLDLVDPASGDVAWTGAVSTFYARTWVENDGDGRQYQVWRFLTNGNMRALAAAGAAPCPVPACAASFGGRVHFFGHLDVAEECASGQRFLAFSFDHDCDEYHHRAGYARAGTFHPDRSFTFVGPSAGFVPDPVMPNPSIGLPSFGSYRNSDLVSKVTATPPRGDICLFEEGLFQGLNQATGDEFCTCAGPGGGPAQYSKYWFGGGTASRDLVTAIEFPTPDAYKISKSIGSWTLPGTFPGVEQLRIDHALCDVEQECPQTFVGTQWFFGVRTDGGFAGSDLTRFGVGVPLDPEYVDMGNAKVYPGFATTTNVRYVSDIIIAINGS